MPLPYGSPIAPACVICERTLAATTGVENAGTLTFSFPRYTDVLGDVVLRAAGPAHATPFSSGSASTGFREPQMTL